MATTTELHSIRLDYQQNSLSVEEVKPNPMEQLQDWLDEALTAEVMEPTAMSLSTATLAGEPSCRTVLLKYLDTGLVFFTNYQSEKGQNLSENPAVCCNFFWPQLERQIRIKGIATRTTREESENYFCSRPEGSQVGAIISPQSKVISSCQELIEQFETESQKGSEERQCPDNWGGYRITPTYIEFWQGRPNRLHDRIVYAVKDNLWSIHRIAP